MTQADDFGMTFLGLRKILEPYGAKLNVVHDTDSNYYLETSHVMKNKQHLFFAAVRRGKGYVSFHLMPIYACSDLLKQISPELRKRMQGKSCFNFKNVNERLFKELAQLTKLGFQKFNDPAYLQKILSKQ